MTFPAHHSQYPACLPPTRLVSTMVARPPHKPHRWLTNNIKAPTAIITAIRIPTTNETTAWRFLVGFDPAPFSAAPIPNQKRSLSIAVSQSSALLCGSMLTTTVNLPTRRAPSPQIRARDTSLDGTTNGSAGVDSPPNVDAGVNSAPDLGEHRCRDHEATAPIIERLPSIS